MAEMLEQVGRTLAFYAALVVLVRLAGKRLAGQTTSFDLVVLITMAVVLQKTALAEGMDSAVVFVATLFVAHRGLTAASARWTWLRRLVRGAPRPLVRDGHVMWDALAAESMSYDDLLAGLRKAGHVELGRIRVAILEETGHISAVTVDEAG
jgi:uncharacterized membrane protein YcaP (DUF421 family)